MRTGRTRLHCGPRHGCELLEFVEQALLPPVSPCVRIRFPLFLAHCRNPTLGANNRQKFGVLVRMRTVTWSRLSNQVTYVSQIQARFTICSSTTIPLVFYLTSIDNSIYRDSKVLLVFMVHISMTIESIGKPRLYCYITYYRAPLRILVYIVCYLTCTSSLHCDITSKTH